METRWFDISRWATRFAWFLIFVAAPRASGACAYQLSAASKYHGAGTANATVNVTAGSGCAWSVTHTNDWITLTSAPTDTGNGNVNYKLSANPQPTRRIGVLTIAGELFTVIQWGTNCESIIAPTSQDRCFGTTTGVVSVTTSSTCGWNVVNSNSWVLITGGASGTGIGKVFYTVISNQTPVARSGVVTIGGQPFSLRQAGFPLHCATNKTAAYGTAWDFDTPIPSDPDNSNLVIQVLSTGTNTLGACGHGYTATRVWQATDRCANSALCAQMVTVLDTTQPILSCPPDKTVECGSAWNFDAPTASDSLGGTDVSVALVSTVTNRTGFCGKAFSATRTWEAFAGCSNRVACSQTVTVADTTPPTVVGAPNKIVECGTAWDFTPPTGFDGCDGAAAIVQEMSTATNITCANGFAATRTWMVLDSCANAATCTQTVMVVDTVPPTLVCAPNKTVECGISWNFDPPAVTDFCAGGAATIIVLSTVTNTVGRCGKTFEATRTWEASDGCSNRIACSQTVSVRDTTPPSLVCAANKIVACDAVWNFDPPSGTDTCAGSNVTIRVLNTVTNAKCGPAFLATRLWEADDGCGNTITCTQTVQVTSKLFQATFPAARTVTCDAPWVFGEPIITGGCGTAVRVVSTLTNALCGRSFTATRQWEISDGCTHVVGRQTVSVVAPPPVVACAWDRLVRCDMIWNFEAPQVLGGCGHTLRVVSTVTNRHCAQSYSAIRTWEISDGCTNLVCRQTVEVIDQSPPTMICPSNITVANFADVPPGPTNLAAFLAAGGWANDNCSSDLFFRSVDGPLIGRSCGGTIQRTHFVTDGCSNSASGIQLITVTQTDTMVKLRLAPAAICDVPPLSAQVTNPPILSVTDNFPVSFMRTKFSHLPAGHIVSNGTYTGWCVDYQGEIVSGYDYRAALYRSDGPLPAHLQNANWDRVNYLLNHKQGDSIDVQNAIWHFIGGPVPVSDWIYHPASATATNLIVDAILHGAGFEPRWGDTFAVVIDIGVGNQHNIVEVKCAGPDPCLGGALTFCAEATGTGPFVFAWLKDGQPLAGETNACLAIANLNPPDAGRYCVRVSTPCGSVTNCLSLPKCAGSSGETGNPRITSIRLGPDGGVRLQISGMAGHRCQIMAGSELGQWAVLGAATIGVSGSSEFLDGGAIGFPHRFYKLSGTTEP